MYFGYRLFVNVWRLYTVMYIEKLGQLLETPKDLATTLTRNRLDM